MPCQTAGATRWSSPGSYQIKLWPGVPSMTPAMSAI